MGEGIMCWAKTVYYQVEYPKSSKKELVKAMEKDPYLKKVEEGKISILSTKKEGSGSKNKLRAVRYITQGLIRLGLLKKAFDTKKECWWAREDFGVYGPSVTKAVAKL